MVYRLDAVDAYERKLVKQIEVASADSRRRPQQALRAAALRQQQARRHHAPRSSWTCRRWHGVQRQEVTVQDGDNLEQTTGRAVYDDCRVGEIRVAKGNEFLELRVPGGEHFLRIGQAYGDVEPLAVQREMIRRTIKEHLDKEMRLRPQGIKVLSLFFIDAVEQYRKYDADGNPVKGEYAAHLRGGVPPAGQAPGLPDALQGSGPDDRTPRRSTTATSPSTRRRSADKTVESNQGHTRRHNAETTPTT